MLKESLQAAERGSATTDIFTVAEKTVLPCDGCWSCGKTGICHITDDMSELYEMLKEADGVIIAAPVYFFDVPAQGKAILDRTCALQPFGQPLANKAGGILVSAGSTGTMDVVKNLYSFFGVHRIFAVNWVGIYSPVEEKKQGMQACRDLGSEMVSFITSHAQFSNNFAPNHITYGTHTQ